jgi:hypothetical protein
VADFRYEVLTGDDQRALMRERLRGLEADHFRLCLELRLAAAVGGVTDDVNAATQIELAAIDVKVTALASWLNPRPAPEPASNGQAKPPIADPGPRRTRTTKKDTGDA